MQTYIIKRNEAGQRLDKFLHKFMPEAQTGFLFKMLRKKNIVLNKQKADGKEILQVGDEISFFFSDETYAKFTSGTVNESEYDKAYRTLKGITVVYMDTDILILNKPVGILTQKAEAGSLSLNEWMIGYLLKEKICTPESLHTFKPSVVNRLDRNTSGMVLCGISLPGSQFLSSIIKQRDIEKYYLTVCVGKCPAQGHEKAQLRKNEARNKVTVSSKGKGNDNFELIETAWNTLCSKSSLNLVKVHLITGKSHQIRAHFSSMGFPLLGDYKYSDDKCRELSERFRCNYQLLHAYELKFPVLTGDWAHLSEKTFTAPLPEHFAEVCKNGNLEIPRS